MPKKPKRAPAKASAKTKKTKRKKTSSSSKQGTETRSLYKRATRSRSSERDEKKSSSLQRRQGRRVRRVRRICRAEIEVDKGVERSKLRGTAHASISSMNAMQKAQSRGSRVERPSTCLFWQPPPGARPTPLPSPRLPRAGSIVNNTSLSSWRPPRRTSRS